MTRSLIRSSILIFAALLLLTAVPGRAGAQDAAALDTDGDGSTDAAEVERGTDPTLWDTDGDGFSDLVEHSAGSDPTNPNSVPDADVTLDSDGDSISDEEELEIGTDPNDPDTDDDRLSDGFEHLEFGTAPLSWDSDDDGYGDGDELEIHRTDPLDPNDYPADSDGGSITVSLNVCHALDACYRPLAGAILRLDGPVSAEAVADARGTVSFEGLPVGDYVLNLSLTGLSGEFRARDAHCGFDDDNGWNGTSSSTTNQIDVTISEPGRDLRCDWMITPLNDPPYWIPTPTEPAPANPTRPDQPVTALPNTGAGPSDSATDRARLPLLALGLAALAAPAVAPKLAARRA